jgi:hypothetical protein
MKVKTIHKFELLLSNEVQEIPLPDAFRFLAVEYIIPRRALFAWFEVTTDLTAEKKPRKIRVFRTGDGIPVSYQYLGTTIDQYLPESYHVYLMEA